MLLSAIWLTCALLDKGVVMVLAAAGADGDVVEATWHQGVEDTLRAGLGHWHGVQRSVLVTQRHQVAVHVAHGWPPWHTEEIRLAIVTDRHLAHGSRNWARTRGGVKLKSLFLTACLWLFVLLCLWTIFEWQIQTPQRIPETIYVFGTVTNM